MSPARFYMRGQILPSTATLTGTDTVRGRVATRREMARRDGVRCCNVNHAIARSQAHRDKSHYFGWYFSVGAETIDHLQCTNYQAFACLTMMREGCQRVSSHPHP